jgi:hypothetical protein
MFTTSSKLEKILKGLIMAYFKIELRHEGRLLRNTTRSISWNKKEKRGKGQAGVKEADVYICCSVVQQPKSGLGRLFQGF